MWLQRDRLTPSLLCPTSLLHRLCVRLCPHNSHLMNLLRGNHVLQTGYLCVCVCGGGEAPTPHRRPLLFLCFRPALSLRGASDERDAVYLCNACPSEAREERDLRRGMPAVWTMRARWGLILGQRRR